MRLGYRSRVTRAAGADQDDRIVDVPGPARPHPSGSAWEPRVDLHLEDGLAEAEVDHWVRSACVLCSNGCGCDIAVKDGRMVGVRGRADDRVNRGRLGPKGLYGSTPWSHSPDRLTRPLVREGGDLVETDWDTAMGRIVAESRRLLDEKGPLSHGFYTSGQLFLEEYYAQAVVGKAGIGTPHMDGNTRLCTATAAASLKESFGADGQPGSYDDVEHAEAIFLYGHNVAETQTVLWRRMLDRIEGTDPPAVVCVDPRETDVARACGRTGGVHLPVRVGTNVALVNGLVRELLTRGWTDDAWVAAHTLGREDLEATVADYDPERVGHICGVEPDDVRRAAEIFGTTDRVLSTVLQGFYQSHQATAASVGVNNLHLLRGMLGRPGCGILQMNGQPTAQNNRETGADGDLTGFRNWQNPQHVQRLAELWNVDPMTIPHWSDPTHAMQIFSYAEAGTIGLLWVSATNPAVSMPESARIKRILGGEQCFVVVQDLFLTETAALADVVLPAAGWGEKTGTFTNADRTVHLSEQAVDPPGEARSDLDIWMAYADAMGFEDKDGAPLVKWRTPEEWFDAWREASAGRPCDYSALSYDTLRSREGIQWPVTEVLPDGTARLYADAHFPSDTDYCETYGHDLLTGGTVTEEQHRAKAPAGRAFLKAEHWTPPHEQVSDEFPLRLTTGRTVYQFHTRTKTGRARPLDAAAPGPWVELCAADAGALGLADGDEAEVTTPRGSIRAPLRVREQEPGTAFVPFHYAGEGQANVLTMTVWDPVSKQPTFKTAACRVAKAGPGGGA
jgi:anaerobic selenocysteine-containing dehydrogenase